MLKKSSFLTLLLIFAGLAAFQYPVLAGYWEVVYTSTGGYSHLCHELDPGGDYIVDPNGSAQYGPFYGYELDMGTSVWGCDIQEGDPSTSGWLYLTDLNGAASGTITPTLQWIPDGEGDDPPEKVWIRYVTNIYWDAVGPNINFRADVYNCCEREYEKWNDLGWDYYPDWSELGGSSSGSGYAELDVSSGCASICLPLSLDLSCSGRFRYLWYSVYAFVIPLDEAPPLPDRISNVPWWTGAPHCYFGSFNPDFNPRRGGTQSGGDPVNLATGAHLYLPAPDITCYNPYGPNATYQRNYLSLRAESGYSSPGLSAGWVDNYDVKIVASFKAEGGINRMTLVYPNGSEDILYNAIQISIASQTPGSAQQNLGGNSGIITALDEWEHPINLQAPRGAPYFVTSIPSETPNRWESITLTFKDQTQWTFNTEDGITYYLACISNRMGRHISIIRDINNGNRLSSVNDDSTPANALLNFHYDGNNLSYISDAYGRKVTYTFGSIDNVTCLLSVSQIAASSTANPNPLEQYGYTSIQGHPHITTISSPSPTGSGLSTKTINYDTSTLMVTSLVDANGNQCIFAYDGYNGKTKVQIKNPQNTVVKEWTECFDPSNGNISIGSMNATHRITTLIYDDGQNSGLPTTFADSEGNTTDATYDKFGNILTVQDSRGTTTTYWYNYPDSEDLDDEYPDSEYPTDFRLGRLMKMQQETKAQTTFTYYEPSGLIHTITTPKPGTTGGSETVTTAFTYDSLGNTLTKVVPGNPANQTTTYNYTQDGVYTQSAKLGQPLTITDNLGHTTHYRYDDRGNMIQCWDALGNTTDVTYNITDQIMSTVYPSVP